MNKELESKSKKMSDRKTDGLKTLSSFLKQSIAPNLFKTASHLSNFNVRTDP